MKKVLAILFTAAIALSVAACGNTNTTSTNPTESTATTAAETTAAATEETTTETDSAFEIGMIDAEEAIIATWVSTEGDGYIFNETAVKIIYSDGKETTGSYDISHKMGEGAFELSITNSITEETTVYTVTFASENEMNVTGDDGYTSTWTTSRSANVDFDPENINADELILDTWVSTEGDGYIFSETAVKIIYSDGKETTCSYDIYKNEDTGAFELSITSVITEETTVYTVEFVAANQMNVTAEGYSSVWNT